jgi:serine/threonine-protein kinase
MLVEALTGRRPFEGQSHAERTLSCAPFRLPASRPAATAVEALLQKCLARDRRDRYVSAATLRNQLLSALHLS